MLTNKFLDPKNSVAFQRIFGSEHNKDILIHFLNDMLVFKERQPIVDVTFLKTIQDPEIAANKTSIIDILCQDEAGQISMAKMQFVRSKGFEKHTQYCEAKTYISQMDKNGPNYNSLKEVVFLIITDLVMFPEKKEYKSDHVILDKKTHEHDLKDFSFTFLELSKFTYNKKELNTMIDKWSYYLKHADKTSEKEIQEIFWNNPIIHKAYEELNRSSWNEEDLKKYDQEIGIEWDNEAVMYEKLSQAEREGIEKGKAEVIKKAKEEAIQEEKQKIERIIDILLQGKVPTHIISRATKISEFDIERMRKYNGDLQLSEQKITSPAFHSFE